MRSISPFSLRPAGSVIAEADRLGPERSVPLRSGKPVISRRGRLLLGDREKYEGLHPLVLEGLHPWVERSMVGTNYEGADLGIALSMI